MDNFVEIDCQTSHFCSVGNRVRLITPQMTFLIKHLCEIKMTQKSTEPWHYSTVSESGCMHYAMVKNVKCNSLDKAMYYINKTLVGKLVDVEV